MFSKKEGVSREGLCTCGGHACPKGSIFCVGLPTREWYRHPRGWGVRADEVRLHEDAPCTRMLHAHEDAPCARMQENVPCTGMHHSIDIVNLHFGRYLRDRGQIPQGTKGESPRAVSRRFAQTQCGGFGFFDRSSGFGVGVSFRSARSHQVGECKRRGGVSVRGCLGQHRELQPSSDEVNLLSEGIPSQSTRRQLAGFFQAGRLLRPPGYGIEESRKGRFRPRCHRRCGATRGFLNSRQVVTWITKELSNG